jgi:acyl-CoA thioester hydrolase
VKGFLHPHRVRSYEVDHQGYLFNGRYLEIADAAMTGFFEGSGFGYPAMLTAGFDPSAVAVEMAFVSPNRLGDDLEVLVTLEHLGTSSLRLLFTIRRDGSETARVRTTYVNVDAAAGVSRPVPDALRAALTARIE